MIRHAGALESRTSLRQPTLTRRLTIRVAVDHEAAGCTHDYDHVVVMLAPADFTLTMDGKTTSS